MLIVTRRNCECYDDLCTLMFDINHGTAPQYLSELVGRCDDTRLRSSVCGFM